MRLILLFLSLNACVRPYLVRECSATVGTHFDAKDYAWVQPCDRKDGMSGVEGDLDGCSPKCRKPYDDCERLQAQFKDPKIWNPKYYCATCKTKAEFTKGDIKAQQDLADIAYQMEQSCRSILHEEQ